MRLHTVDYSAPAAAAELGPLSSPHLRSGGEGYPLSHDLKRVLRQVQERGRQAVLVAPRRGYSAVLRCPACEHTPGCPHCDVPLRFHQQSRSLACHQCGYRQGVPERCECCGERMWQARGPGTEWIAAEVCRLLEIPVLRYDRDHQDDLSHLYAGASGVVVGTSMLLSQPALPELALIGVTLADTWLNISDFRAGERYHRLLWQLAGWHPQRAPLLLVQTFQPGHPALRAVAEGRDVAEYGRSELPTRQALGYPPFTRLATLEVAARDPARASASAAAVAAALYAGGATQAEILGPAPSPVARVRGVYPYTLLLRARSDQRLSELLAVLNQPGLGRVRVDVSPRGMV
ncbi:hypothetical protein ACFP81_08920 [Deinococcus lacus]|uniref:Primosomal protein N n=1 Tax=Deinococcus lacus TaxID=392561 RepID=A0ABW1YCQ6_9DEIO